MKSPARYNRRTGNIEVNVKDWPNLPADVKEFILWHERGHKDLNTRNESLADAYAMQHIGTDEAIKTLKYYRFRMPLNRRNDILKEIKKYNQMERYAVGYNNGYDEFFGRKARAKRAEKRATKTALKKKYGGKIGWRKKAKKSGVDVRAEIAKAKNKAIEEHKKAKFDTRNYRKQGRKNTRTEAKIKRMNARTENKIKKAENNAGVTGVVSKVASTLMGNTEKNTIGVSAFPPNNVQNPTTTKSKTGLIVGGVAGVLVIGLILFFVLRKKK